MLLVSVLPTMFQCKRSLVRFACSEGGQAAHRDTGWQGYGQSSRTYFDAGDIMMKVANAAQEAAASAVKKATADLAAAEENLFETREEQLDSTLHSDDVESEIEAGEEVSGYGGETSAPTLTTTSQNVSAGWAKVGLDRFLKQIYADSPCHMALEHACSNPNCCRCQMLMTNQTSGR